MLRFLPALIAAAMLIVAGFIYLAARMRRLPFLQKLSRGHKVLAGAVAVALVCSVWLFAIINVMAALVAFLHLLVIWLLCDLAAAIVRRVRRRERGERYITGYVAIALTAACLSGGWFFAHHIFETRYDVVTDKPLGGDLRVVEISDSHLGITLSGEEFADVCRQIESAGPDIVVIVGDFVDDDTAKEDMERACKALGELKTTYGVYFVYGNHDRGYSDYRDFTADELHAALEDNSVVILEDESVLVGGRFWLVGRRDRSYPGRAEAISLTEGIDDGRFILMLDHQPNDYAAEAASGADLVLSGHTHGGHIFPAGQIGLAIGANDKLYGLERRGDTTFVVSSGVSGWAIPFKTGAISEYVVIDITEKK